MWFLLAAFLNDSLKALVAAELLRRVLPECGIQFDKSSRILDLSGRRRRRGTSAIRICRGRIVGSPRS